MERNRAARSRGNCSRAKDGRLTESIVSNSELIRLVGGSVAFAMAMLAIPTVLAILKQWRWF